jgi:hypothetical protein
LTVFVGTAERELLKVKYDFRERLQIGDGRVAGRVAAFCRRVSYTSFFKQSTSEPIIGENSMRSYSKKMRPGREVNLLTPRYKEKILTNCQNEPTSKTNSNFILKFQVDSVPMVPKKIATTP